MVQRPPPRLPLRAARHQRLRTQCRPQCGVGTLFCGPVSRLATFPARAPFARDLRTLGTTASSQFRVSLRSSSRARGRWPRPEKSPIVTLFPLWCLGTQTAPLPTPSHPPGRLAGSANGVPRRRPSGAPPATSQRFRLCLRRPEETRPDECRADRLCRHRRHRHDDRYRSFRTRLFHYWRPHGRGPRNRTGAPSPGRPAPGAHAGRARGPHCLQGPSLHQGRPLAGHGLLPPAVPHARGRLRAGARRARLRAAAHRPRRLVGLGRRTHRLAVRFRDRGSDDPALAPDPGRPGRPALRPGLRRR